MAKKSKEKKQIDPPNTDLEPTLGRPPLEISEDEVRRLAEMHCTNEEIAYFFGCSADTIERRFVEILRQERARGVISVKRALFRKATIDEDLGAIIWWTKNFASMSDKVESKVTAKVESKGVQETPAEQLLRLKEMVKDGES